MKKSGVLVGLMLAISLLSFSLALAEPCNLDISLVNQDPYPAVQGEEARLVFQIDGLENTECGTVELGLIEKYPIALMPDQESFYRIEAGTFKKDFKSFFLAPFKVRVSSDAMDGDNKIEVQYRHGINSGYVTKDFNLNVQDTRADFEIHVKSYDLTTRKINFEILNIAEEDINALTVEIPKQDNIQIKGANRNIVGDLDSNEYTTAEFEAILKDGKIKLLLHYSDKINERRTIEEEVDFESEYFQGMVSQQKKSPIGTYIFLGIIVLLIVWWIIRRKNKKKKALAAKLKARK